MTLTALIISLFIQFGFINSESDLKNTPSQQQEQWYKEIIEDEFTNF
jgi:hypothetical protein